RSVRGTFVRSMALRASLTRHPPYALPMEARGQCSPDWASTLQPSPQWLEGNTPEKRLPLGDEDLTGIEQRARALDAAFTVAEGDEQSARVRMQAVEAASERDEDVLTQGGLRIVALLLFLLPADALGAGRPINRQLP